MLNISQFLKLVIKDNNYLSCYPLPFPKEPPSLLPSITALVIKLMLFLSLLLNRLVQKYFLIYTVSVSLSTVDLWFLYKTHLWLNSLILLMLQLRKIWMSICLPIKQILNLFKMVERPMFSKEISLYLLTWSLLLLVMLFRNKLEKELMLFLNLTGLKNLLTT